MSNPATQRIKRELKSWSNDDSDFEKTGIKLTPIDDSLTKFKGEIKGPPDTPYNNGHFLLDIIIPDTYPFKPPKAKFITRLWHPNVSSVTGAICLDLLKDQWAASMSLRTLLMSLQLLLSAPQPNDPQDAVVAGQYLNNQECFKRTARYWSQYFARAPGPIDEFCQEKMIELNTMGYDSDRALEALSHCDWITERSVHRLLAK